MNATLSPQQQQADRPAGRPEPFAAARPGAGASGSNAARRDGAAADDRPREGFWGHYVTDRLRHFSLD